MYVIIENSEYISLNKLWSSVENIEDFFTNKTKRCVFLFFKGNLSSFEAWFEELIKLNKKIRKEGYLFILREFAYGYVIFAYYHCAEE